MTKIAALFCAAPGLFCLGILTCAPRPHAGSNAEPLFLTMYYAEDSTGERAVGMIRPSGESKHRLFSYANWVPKWQGFAVITADGHLASLSSGGVLSRKGALELSASCSEWAIDESGRLLAVLTGSEPGVKIQDILTGKVVRNYDEQYMRRKAVAFEKGDLSLHGVALSSEGTRVAFAIARPGSEDSAAIFKPSTIIIDANNDAVRVIQDVVPILFLSNGNLLSWTDRGEGAYNKVFIIDHNGKIVSSLAGVVAVGSLGNDILVIVPHKSKTQVQRWNSTFTKKLWHKDIALAPTEIPENVSFGPMS